MTQIEPAGPHHATHLADEMHPFGRSDVVHHADRGHQIEAEIVERKAPAVEGLVVDVAVVGARLRDAGRGNVDTAEAADHAAQQGMKAADAAADIEHGGLFLPEPPRDQIAQQVGLGAHEETMRQAGEVDRGLHHVPVVAAVAVE